MTNGKDLEVEEFSKLVPQGPKRQQKGKKHGAVLQKIANTNKHKLNSFETKVSVEEVWLGLGLSSKT